MYPLLQKAARGLNNRIILGCVEGSPPQGSWGAPRCVESSAHHAPSARVAPPRQGRALEVRRPPDAPRLPEATGDEPSGAPLWRFGQNSRTETMSGLCAVPRRLAALSPETPDVMDLECGEGGRKQRIWGGGRRSRPPQPPSPGANSRRPSARPAAEVSAGGRAPRAASRWASRPGTKATHGDALIPLQPPGHQLLSFPQKPPVSADATPGRHARALSPFPKAAAIRRKAPTSGKLEGPGRVPFLRGCPASGGRTLGGLPPREQWGPRLATYPPNCARGCTPPGAGEGEGAGSAGARGARPRGPAPPQGAGPRGGASRLEGRVLQPQPTPGAPGPLGRVPAARTPPAARQARGAGTKPGGRRGPDGGQRPPPPPDVSAPRSRRAREPPGPRDPTPARRTLFLTSAESP